VATVFSTTDRFFDGPVPTGAALTTITLATINTTASYFPSVSADAIFIRWQTTDAEIMRLLGSDVPSTTDSVGIFGTGTQSNSTALSSESSYTTGLSSGPARTTSQSAGGDGSAAMQPTSSSLAPGAIAGIAIGSFGVLMLMLIGWALVGLKRHKAAASRDRSTGNPESEKDWAKPGLDGRGISEKPGARHPRHRPRFQRTIGIKHGKCALNHPQRSCSKWDA
jgi:hypothetical protein